MTKAQVQALIDSNLASNTVITAQKHIEVENALLNYMDSFSSLIPIKVGQYGIGNPPSGTSTYQVVISGSPLPTANYIVVSSLRSASGNPSNDLQTIYAIGDTTQTGFKIYIRETANVTQNIAIDYALFAF